MIYAKPVFHFFQIIGRIFLLVGIIHEKTAELVHWIFWKSDFRFTVAVGMILFAWSTATNPTSRGVVPFLATGFHIDALYVQLFFAITMLLGAWTLVFFPGYRGLAGAIPIVLYGASALFFGKTINNFGPVIWVIVILGGLGQFQARHRLIDN